MHQTKVIFQFQKYFITTHVNEKFFQRNVQNNTLLIRILQYIIIIMAFMYAI